MCISSEPSCSSIRVAIAENTAMRVQLLCDALKQVGMTVACSAANSREFLGVLDSVEFDVVIVGSTMDEEPGRGLKLIRQLRESIYRMPPIVILMESSGPDSVVDVFRAGAKGVISRRDSLDSLKDCLLSVHAGQVWATKEELSYAVEALSKLPSMSSNGKKPLGTLSSREKDVIRCLAEGLTNREIGHRLGLSPHTVKNYLFRIFDKVGVSNRVELLFLMFAPAAPGSITNEPPMSIFECRKAATAGDPGQQLRLAGLYREGHGVPQNLVQAYKWLLICDETIRTLGDRTRELKEKVSLKIAPSDLIEAQRRAYEYFQDKQADTPRLKVVSELKTPSTRRVPA
jgi:DNA-binding NarL/FixJ family response regulator